MTKGEMLELASGLEHAARVTWRMQHEDEAEWGRPKILRVVAGLSRAAREARSLAASHKDPQP